MNTYLCLAMHLPKQSLTGCWGEGKSVPSVSSCQQALIRYQGALQVSEMGLWGSTSIRNGSVGYTSIRNGSVGSTSFRNGSMVLKY